MANANARKTHCKRGHPLSGDNLFIGSVGKRECRTCRAASQRRSRRTMKELHALERPAELTWATAHSADGPKVAKWLDDNLPELNNLTNPNGMRRVRDWREGARVDVWALDKLLTRHFRHLSDLPDSVWLPGHARHEGHNNLPRTGSKPKPLEPRQCMNCGKDIPFHKPSGSRYRPLEYEKRMFCTTFCQGEAKKVTPEPKPCERCGDEIPLVRESGTRVQPHHYRALRFCGCACANADRSERLKVAA